MRFAWILLFAACADSDLDANAQGACSNLDTDACTANPGCQMAFTFGGFQATVPLHCLAIVPGPTASVGCPQDRDGCRARASCSPMFLQRLGPTDAPDGDPQYDHCELTTAVLADE